MVPLVTVACLAAGAEEEGGASVMAVGTKQANGCNSGKELATHRRGPNLPWAWVLLSSR